MPKYSYQLTNGKSLVLDGDTPPSDDDVESVAKQQGVQLVPHNQEPSADEIIKGAKSFLSDTPKNQDQVTDQQPKNPDANQGFLSKAKDYLTQPLTTIPSKAAEYLSQKFEHPNVDDSELLAKLKGFAGGAVKGLGDVASGFTSPLNLALMAVGAGEASPALESIQPALTAARRIMSGGVAAEGGYHAVTAPTMGGKLQGIAEAAAGLAGMHGGPSADLSPELQFHDNSDNSGAPPPGAPPPSAPPEINSQSASPVNLPPDLIPVGEEQQFNNNRPSNPTTSLEDKLMQIIRDKQNMGQPLPIEETRTPGDFPVVDASKVSPEDLQKLNDFMGHGLSTGETEELRNLIHDDITGANRQAVNNVDLKSQIESEVENANNIRQQPNKQRRLIIKNIDGTTSIVPGSQEEADFIRSAQEHGTSATDILDMVKKQFDQPAINPVEETKPTAKFLGMGPDGPLFNVEGGPYDRSTKSLGDLQKLGIEAPEVPENAPRVSGDVLRQQALDKMKSSLENETPNSENDIFNRSNTKPNVFPADEHVTPEIAAERKASGKPRYRLDPKDNSYTPIDETGTPIGAKIYPKNGSIDVLPSNLKQPEMPFETPEEKIIRMRKAGSDGGAGNGGGGDKPPNKQGNMFGEPPPDKPTGKLQKLYDLARGLISVDLPYMTSASFRQASPYVGTADWFKAWIPAAKAFGSKEAFEAINSEIQNRPNFKNYNNQPSFASQAGLKLSDLKNYSRREEMIRGELAEKIPIYGKYVAASNRAYTAFLNSLRAARFDSLISAAEKEGLNPRRNIGEATKIADAINTLTGRGKLATGIGSHEINVESHARLLSNMFFSPRKIASEIQMLNPSTYMMTNPVARRELLAGLIRRTATWWTVAGLAKFAGAQVSTDPSSADFGKIKIGNARIDPPGGMQQYLVLGAQTAMNGKTSTNTNQFTPFGKGFKPETRGSNIADFALNRAHPMAKFIIDSFRGTQKTPFHLGDRTLQLATPMYVDDLVQVAKDNPELAPFILGFSGVGVGTQSYERGSYGKPTFIPEKYDFNIGAK